MVNTVRIGCISELKFKAKLLELGIQDIVEPITNSLPYDFAIDTGKKFIKIQVKTGKMTKTGVIKFNTCGVMCNMTKIVRKTYKGKIDYFGVYCPDNDGYYLIPIEETGSREKSLRVSPTKNNNQKNINWATKYLIETRLSKKW